MQIVVNTKYSLGDKVKYYQNDLIKKNGGQEVVTTEMTSEIEEIRLVVTDDGIEVKYKMKSHAVREDNTIIGLA